MKRGPLEPITRTLPMNTKWLMSGTAGVLALFGLLGTFAPADVIRMLGALPVEPLPVVVQLLGALYLAFALTNWTAKDNMIGGIYSRPISIGNLLHFVSGALALLKQQWANGFHGPLAAVMMVYIALAAAFWWLVFVGPTAMTARDAPNRT